MTVARWGALTAAALVSACSTQQSPVPVQGAPSAVRRLVGSWAGGYESARSGRSGSISFTLASEHDTAYGDVIMTPRGMNHPLYRAAVEEPRGAGGVHQQLLTIRFVAVRNDQVEGTLEPYRDPECGCLLITRFEGRVMGDSIVGSFRSRHVEGGIDVPGTWQVRRQPMQP